VAGFGDAHLVVAVILSPKPSEKIPLWEQEMSAGAVCLSLVNACLAAGLGSGLADRVAGAARGFCDRGLGLAPQESVAGFIHIGSETRTPPERPAPTWMRSRPGSE
jgi:hypothetical protein